MKRFIALTVVLMAVAGLTICFAGTERYSSKEVAPVIQPECNWTGFYLGLHAGWAEGPLSWIDSDTDTFPGTTPDTGAPEVLAHQKPSGFLGGVQAGYNYQWNWLVVGVEGEFSYADVKAKDNFTDAPNVFDARTDWQGTIAGRVGLAWNKWLFYGKGGGVFAHNEYRFAHGNDLFTADETRVAPMVGVGIEYMINCNWSAKLEYQHSFFGSESVDGTNIEDEFGTTSAGPSIEKERYDFDLTHNSIKVGLNYKF